MGAEVLLSAEILDDHARRVRAAVLAEREACAKAICLACRDGIMLVAVGGLHVNARLCDAAAIRART